MLQNKLSPAAIELIKQNNIHNITMISFCQLLLSSQLWKFATKVKISRSTNQRKNKPKKLNFYHTRDITAKHVTNGRFTSAA